MRMAHLGGNDHNMCLSESPVPFQRTDFQGNFFYCKYSPEGTGVSLLLSHLVVLVLLPARVSTLPGQSGSHAKARGMGPGLPGPGTLQVPPDQRGSPEPVDPAF